MVGFTSEHLTKNLEVIRGALDYKPEDNPDDIIQKLELLSGVLGLASETKAHAESNYNQAFFVKSKSPELKGAYAAERNKAIDSECRIEFLVFKISKDYRDALESQMDYYRSRLSFAAKEYYHEHKSSPTIRRNN